MPKRPKIMVVDSPREENPDFLLGGEKIEAVDEFNYLGSLITKEGSCIRELHRHLALA
jgi:hypothetical protein